MLWRKLSAARGVGGPITYRGAVTASLPNVDLGGWSSGANTIDVLSLAAVGDLVVIALTFDEYPDAAWSWGGMAFTSLSDATSAVSPGSYCGYAFVQAGDSNPYPTDVIEWRGLSVVAAVFSNVTQELGHAVATGLSGNPNPPSVTAAGDLWIATGHLDDDGITVCTAPGGYTIAAFAQRTASYTSSTMLAYNIASASAENPSTFVTDGDDAWAATTIAFS